MIPELSSSLKSFFLLLWSLLGTFTIPGTPLTGQHLLVAPLGALAFVTVLKKILDIGGVGITHSGGSIGASANYYDNKGQEDD